jgi:signal transduction histidine kinase
VKLRARRTISRLVGLATAGFVIAALVLTFGDRYTDAVDIPAIVAFLLGMGGLGIVGGLLTSKAPTNPIGPLFQAAALLSAVAIAASEYATRGLSDLQGLRGVPLAGLIADVAYIPPACALLTAYLIFPDGRVLGRRWRIVLGLLWGGAILVVIGSVLGSGSFEGEAGRIDNPLSSGDHHVLHLGAAAGGWCIAAGGVLALASVVVRFRRSRGEERQQLLWLVGAAILILASVVAMTVTSLLAGPDGTSTANDLAWTAFLASILIGLPLATSVAVLRYRLYDLDLVVKKTAIYSIVAVVLTALYLLLVGAAALAGLGSIPAVLIFVITFNPVRRRARRLADRIVYGKRATPFEVLSEFSERVGETYSIDDVLPRMTQLLSASTGAREVRTWIRTRSSLHSAAVAPAEAAATVADVPLVGGDLPSFGADVHAFAVTHQGELLGAITLTMATNDPMDSSKERLAQGVASQAGLALRNVRLVEELRASRRRIVAAQDERAKTLERNIHDGAQQQLVALAVKLRLAEQLAERDPAAVASMLRDLQDDATTTLEDLRDLARGIYPPLLADKGLPAALEAQARKAMIPVELLPDGVGRYAPDVESGVYFCVLEALNNVAKYADASNAVIALSQTDAELAFEVRDDGRGFDPAQTPRGTGLQGMADRLDAIGGELVIETSIGAGTSVRGRIRVGRD